MKWKEIVRNDNTVTYRHGHRAVATGDCIFIYGGGNRRICKQFHGWNIRENKNFYPKFTGKMCSGVASFGMVLYKKNFIIIFGGMVEYGRYTNDLYTLDLSTWNWKKYGQSQKIAPAPRIGHSFTLIDENRVMMFGGIINTHPNLPNTLKYMNDMYILHIIEEDKFKWQKLVLKYGPCPRESHSAVFYNDFKGKRFLIIFGGMNGNRLGDLWFLDLNQMIWTQFVVSGLPPTPRSLHTACLLNSKMYIFGGWVNKQPADPLSESPSDRYETTNLLSYLDIATMTWINFEDYDEVCPSPRAGHSMTAVDKRLYLWGGRSNYSEIEDDYYIVTNDFWYLETEIPNKISHIDLVRATSSSIEIKWDEISNAEFYLVEIHKVQAVPFDIRKLRIKSISPKNNHEKSNEIIYTNKNKRKSDDLDEIREKRIIKEAKIADENNNEVNAKDNKTEIKVLDESKMWLTVGFPSKNSYTVDGFYKMSVDTADLNLKSCPNAKYFKSEMKVCLTPDTMYVFRVAAINSMGVGEWSKLFYFKTSLNDPPSVPSNCKFIPTPQGLRLAWTPNPLSEKILKYNVYIAIIRHGQSKLFDFLCVYAGQQPTCHVLQDHINKAHQEIMPSNDNKKSVIFRITATNNNGTSIPLLITYILSKK